MNWDNIRVFLAVARFGSVSQAGRELGLNHSTVLRRIDALEAELGARLFSRRPKGYEITAVGERILDAAAMMERDAQTLQRQLLATDSQVSGPLQVAMPPGVCLDLMAEIGEFKRRYPLIELDLDSQPGLHNLDSVEADVAIRLTNEPPPHCVAHPLFEMPFGLYASGQYLERCGVPQSIADADWICYSLPSVADSMEQWLRGQCEALRLVATVNTLALVLQGVMAGVGVSFLPRHIATARTGLVKLDLLTIDYRVPVYLLAHRDLCFQPRVKAFLDFMREQLSGRQL